MMGTCMAPIYQLFPSSTQPAPTLPPPPPPLKPNKFQIPESTRRGLLLSLPIFAATTGFLNGTSTSTKDSITASLRGFARAASYYDPLSQAEKDASTAISLRVNKALELLEKGRELQAVGDFNKALLYFTMVVENYKDFAFSEYARVGRAIALYEVGDREKAIAEMEDVSISLKGYPEVHAALAAALYQDKHAPLLAENQFAIATLLDPHYTDLSYVKQTKHWPPSLVDSLQHFINLS